ncbi:MAG: pyruvate kinase, partial [Lachnoclostridium sp.]|nr:pyruvate kinase [Lachnoclostridium sp.]
MRKTKIICTLGPATDNEKVLRYLIQNGMDVARFNFSHGSHEEHGKRMELLRRLREEINPSLAALLDTRGPEVRIKCFRDGKAELKKGQKFTLCCKDTEGTNEKVSITYEKLCDDVKKNTTILLDDGLIEMTVLEIKDSDIVCEVKNDGILTDRKGINIPEIHLSLPYLSKTDKEDILFGIEHDFDYIAASFV